MKPISTLRLCDHAYSTFTEKLLSRDIQTGQILSQRELVELTGMPLGAIREMVPRLEANGLIKTVSKRGLQVLSIDVKLVRDAFQLRSIIESEAIAEFCTAAPKKEIENLENQHQKLRKEASFSVSSDILKTAQQIDWNFHELIVDRMENALISDTYRVNTIKIRLIRNSDTRMLPELVVSVLDEHLAVIAALKACNTQGAVAALQTHIYSAKRRALGM